MTLNYYRLTPPSKYQRHVDYNSLPRYITYIIIDFYIITVLDCKVSPLLIFYECFFSRFVLFIVSFCRVLREHAYTFSPNDKRLQQLQDGVATPSSYDYYYCRAHRNDFWYFCFRNWTS